MPVAPTDVVTRYTVKTGSAGDTTAGTAAGSLGGFTSTTAWPDATTLFDDISGAENTAGTVDYRAVDILNNHATLTMISAVVYISSEVAGGASVALAVDNVGPVAKGSGAQGASIANETTAPTGVGAFSAPTTVAAGLALGNIGPGQVRRVWIRRTAANTVAVDVDGFTLGVGYDSAA